MKRLPRELKQDAGKYIALFLFLVATIGFVSGFLVADNSMTSAYDESFKKYSIEDGHFTLAAEADDSLISRLEEEGVSVYELFYKNVTLDNENNMRIFKDRADVNKACLMEGSMPSKDDEIAIDRLYAENNKISIGDYMTINGKTFTVEGFVSLSDYSSMFKNNTDMMFDATHFSIAVVADSAFDSISDNGLEYCYAWRNNNRSLSKNERAVKADDLKELLKKNGILTDFVKQEDNQAINFTGEDMGTDKSTMICMLYVVMVVLAFVSAVTTKSTIEQESSAIGTLRASGYTRGELLRHYLALPIIVTLVAAVIGNVLGYTVMKDICVELYYHSYSLPIYVTLWNGEAFLMTTVIPCLIILIVSVVVLSSILSLPPLSFLRHELKKKSNDRVVRLEKGSFLTRFRMRIILQNIPAYITLFIGIFLASLMLIFGMVMNPILSNYKKDVINSKISDYQYILKAPVETENTGVEKYSVTSLNLPDEGEEITVYGISLDSAYLSGLKLPQKEGEVIVSRGYLEKYNLKVGDTIRLEMEYANKTYSFTIAGDYDYASALSIFMTRSEFNTCFDYNSDYYNGYFSNEKLTDIDKAYIASVITQKDLTVIADQLDDSMGSMFSLISGFAGIVYMLLMYLLAKLVIEKNVRSISMIKILGYTNQEAGGLYNAATAIVVGVSLIVTLPFDCLAMKGLFYIFMKEINGWLTFWIAPWICPAMLIIGAACYFLVHIIQSRKIIRIPMSQALKNME
jgi:putative ABC transport system permease protein